MERIRIVMGVTKPILASIVRTALAIDPILDVFEASPQDAPGAARRLEAQLVILEEENGELSTLAGEVLRCWPDVRVMLLARDGREAFLWELRPHRVALGELSTDALRETVRHLGHQAVA